MKFNQKYWFVNLSEFNRRGVKGRRRKRGEKPQRYLRPAFVSQRLTF